MIQIALSLAIVYATAFILSRFGKLGTVVGITLGSVIVAFIRIIPQTGPVAETVDLLGTIGLLVGMFLAGNSFDTRGSLKSARSWFLVLGQMGIMMILGALVGRALGNETLVGSLVIGFAVMQSSTAIVVDAIRKRNWLDEPVGILGMTLMVVQDVASGMLPLALGLVLGQQTGAINVVWLAILSVSFICLYIAGSFIGKQLLGHALSPNESPFIMGLSVALLAGVTAQFAGISAATAAFIAGLLWRRTKFVAKTEAQLGLARDLLVPLFFISALRIADLSLVNLFSTRTLVFIIFELLATLLITYPLARYAGIGPLGSTILSISSAQAGEFTFFVVFLATRFGIMSPAEGGALAFASVVTFLISAMASDAGEKIFHKTRKFLTFFDKGAAAPQETAKQKTPPSVIFLDVPEGTKEDVASAISPWVKKQLDTWPDSSVLAVESVSNEYEEPFLRSLGADVFVYEPYLDPVSTLKLFNLSKMKVVVSGPALGIRQDLDLIEFLRKNYPETIFITVASNRIEADELDKATKDAHNVIVVNETRDLAKNLGSVAISI
ncbi:MAG: hypothetical protein UX65_C0013G0006 [Parcubacteria group bacterium GW2011_GWB1_46_8]|nr:MAG: hypothetical protein UX14_C0019G0007 [Parcubacteria group bacterium GW2011_GWF1_45_5]KKU43375.1 MAG: hypothetical protein UX61_C0022G0003 [Parcubacteria group bacterium GW2011_GWA2_46_7]KKU45976.1 MAG: hypothetical protein UX65_C0013G0006 [Parcubacteria group bacterium GW2011_GWB1_46_8]